MIHWNPFQPAVKVWMPVGGWNAAFSDKEKIQCTSRFFFLKEKKGYSDSMSQTLSHMVVFKQKYHGLQYSEEEEQVLAKALTPVIHSVITET